MIYNQNPFTKSEQFNSNFPMKERTMNLSGSSSESSTGPFKNIKRRQITPKSGYIYDEYMYAGTRQFIPQDNGPSVMNVFNDNIYDGIKKLREYARKSTMVAIDTEFPGTVVRLSTENSKTADLYYQNVKINTDILKPIQIGFSFFTNEGNPVDDHSTIQFNFKWNIEKDLGNQDSLTLLEKSGIDFEKLQSNGIDPDHFAELFIATGLLCNENITWVGFHSSHDWAYILKIVTGWNEMPAKFADFQTLLQIYFPRTIDLKTVVMEKKIYGCGLQDLSSMLNVTRYGCQHQAGSDSRLTGETYLKFVKTHFEGQVFMEWYNQIFGLNFDQSPFASDRSSPYSVGEVTPDEDTNSNDD